MASDTSYLTDDDPMPFGKYASPPTKMRDVPASYLLWLWDNGLWRDESNAGGINRGGVRQYIIERFHALETECPDTIIEHRP
jgi:hypothetical protein